MKAIDSDPEIEPVITWRQRPSETISVSLPLDALATMTRIAEENDLSIKGLLMFYISQGLRLDLEREKADTEPKQASHFTKRINAHKTVIVLEPDVAAVFQTSESVNAILRALIKTMPQKAV